MGLLEKSSLQQLVAKKKYLTSLKLLINRNIIESDLLSVESTKFLVSQAKEQNIQSKNCVVFFENFEAFLSKISLLLNYPLYLFIDKSAVVGAYRLKNILDINILNFFDFDENGIVSIVSEDLSVRILFEPTVDESHRKIIITEISGINYLI